MDMILLYILGSVLYTECIAGAIINLIIVAAIIMKWRTMKSLNLGDKILSSLAIARSLYLLSAFMVYLSIQLNLWDDEKFQLNSTLCLVTIVFLHFTNLWLATVLCVFYCVKITSYSWKFFIFLKTKISTLVPWFLVASLLITLAFGLPLGWSYDGKQNQNLTNVSLNNLLLARVLEQQTTLYKFLLLLIGSLLPFLVFLIANSLLLHSLWMHTRRMRSSGSGFRCPNLESHFSAAKSMSLFLVLQTIYFVISVYTSMCMHGSITSVWVTLILAYNLPTLHSLYIIYSNSELRKTCISMYQAIL